MKFGSLFSGIGGLDLGLERAGMECAWQVEIDDYCQRVLTKHWPDVPKYKDIRDVGKELGAVDLICGGFPCQPFSVAGKRKGTADDRHLWPEMLRVISELKPTWVLGENVPGIINIFLDQAVSDLEAEGYTCEAYVLPAAGFDAPHKRERLFIIAHRSRIRRDTGRPKQSLSGIGEHGKASPGNVGGTSRDERPISFDRGSADVRNPTEQGLPNRRGAQVGRKGKVQELERPDSNGRARWATEPNVGRVAHGVPHRVDRLRGLGNAVVPQVAEFIGRQIINAHSK